MRALLLSALLLVCLGFASVTPSDTAAQQSPVIGIIAQGGLSTQPSPNGDRRVKFPFRLRCQEKGSKISSFANCSDDPSQVYPKATVRYTVTAATRAKYKLPSTTLAKAEFKGETSTREIIKPSLAMSKALGRIANGKTITIKTRVAFTFPIVETRSDSTTLTVGGSGDTGWSVRTSNIDDGTGGGGGGKG